nr:Mannan synthase 1 [Ipomoea batatas]
MKHKSDAMKEDLEQNRNYPMVLVQIPMYNEKEVYKLSIGAVCGLSWPADRLIVQVLDDSTTRFIRRLVVNECEKWKGKGVNVKYETRNNRNGYKAGALHEGLNKNYVKDCEFVAIFDADFQPDADFLLRTIPYLLENPELGLVQAKWNLGSAGVWRIQALNDAGGWKDRTTVEDMDLAIRANLRGWKFLYVGDLEHASLYKKFQVIYVFFVRKIIAHWVTLFFYCLVIPVIVVHPEIHLVKPLALYLPATVTILNAACRWRSIHLILPWILFNNAMCLHRANAVLVGLLGGSGVNEWVVTEKLGYALNRLRIPRTQEWQFMIDRIHLPEFLMGLNLMHTAVYDLMYGNQYFYAFLFMQGAAFIAVGVSNVGIFIPN